MAQTIQCARCGAAEDAASASFSEEGLVCARCHGGDLAQDAAQLRAQVSAAEAGFQKLERGFEALTGAAPAGSAHRPPSATGHGPAGEFARAPASGLHAALAARGLTVQRQGLHKTLELPVVGRQESAGYREVWRLPGAAPVQASFSREGLSEKLVKLFRKEIQTGDKGFDDAVYVRTDTPDATRALLASDEVRAVIRGVVERGGGFSIEGAAVEGEVLWPENEPGARPQDLVARVVAAVLGE